MPMAPWSTAWLLATCVLARARSSRAQQVEVQGRGRRTDVDTPSFHDLSSFSNMSLPSTVMHSVIMHFKDVHSSWPAGSDAPADVDEPPVPTSNAQPEAAAEDATVTDSSNDNAVEAVYCVPAVVRAAVGAVQACTVMIHG